MDAFGIDLRASAKPLDRRHGVIRKRVEVLVVRTGGSTGGSSSTDTGGSTTTTLNLHLLQLNVKLESFVLFFLQLGSRQVANRPT